MRRVLIAATIAEYQTMALFSDSANTGAVPVLHTLKPIESV
jgi:hypothetical protein